MDGSEATVANNQFNSVKRGKILGGVIGGAFGLAVVVLLLYWIIISIRNRQQHNRITQQRKIQFVALKRSSRSIADACLPVDTDISKDILKGDSLDLIRATRPFPGSPRMPPSPPPTEPYTSTNIHHETPFIHLHGAKKGGEHANPFL